jgi:purine-binding chemotaxis protein CheW
MSAVESFGTPVVTNTGGSGAKYLTFTLAGEDYALPVLEVREIIQMVDVTPVPQVAAHVRGVINLRGKVIPLIDLRTRLGFPTQADTERTCVIVVEVQAGPSQALCGVIVDAVSDVLTIPAHDIEDTPDLGGRVHAECIRGLAKVKGRVTILLDLDVLLRSTCDCRTHA